MIGETFKIDTAWQGINKVSFATACFPGHEHKLSTTGELIRCIYQMSTQRFVATLCADNGAACLSQPGLNCL